MKVAGEAVIDAPVEEVWQALLDPEVLVRTIPGCERLESQGGHRYGMTVTAGLAAVRGTYAGSYELQDLRPHESLRLKAACAGAPGTIDADVTVGFADRGDGRTLLRYDADAVVGGMVGGVGQRMLTSVGKRMAGEFFANVQAAISAPPGGPAPALVATAAGVPREAAAVAGAVEAGRTFVAPARAVEAGGRRDFVTGVLVGGGLVLAGVIAGAFAARRRH